MIQTYKEQNTPLLHKEHRLNLHRAMSVLEKQVKGSSRLLREDVCRKDHKVLVANAHNKGSSISRISSLICVKVAFYTFNEDRLMKHRAAKERRLAFKQKKITGILSMKVVFIYIFSMKVSFLFSFLFILFPF